MRDKDTVYGLCHELLSIDLDSVSLSQLAILEYVCDEMLEFVRGEFAKRGFKND